MPKFIDLTGQKIGNLTVIKTYDTRFNQIRWLCKCNCGSDFITGGYGLRHGETKSCGCEVRIGVPIGKISGKLTVISYEPHKKGHRPACKCKCSCGNECVILIHNIRVGKTTSCGCLVRGRGDKSLRFSGYKEIYGIYWTNVKNGAVKRNMDFDISIEYAWELFIKQQRRCALSGLEIYFKNTLNNIKATASLDRINSNKGYIEGNVQWVHKDINQMKMDLPEDKFINYCKLISNNN